MPVPPIPPPLEQAGQRPFSFYPPILGVEHNQWVYVRATWSEVIVRNTRSDLEVFLPRQYLGEVSRVGDPMMIVGLTKELEYKGGAVWPHRRRVIEMPRAVGDVPRAAVPEALPQPAPVVNIRLEAGAESRVGRLIVTALVAGLVLCVLVVSFFRGGLSGGHITYRTVLQSDLDLSHRDDYFAVIRKLGSPAADRWQSANGVLQYRVLTYPDRQIAAVLMGSDRQKVLYIGALDRNWRPVHTVTLESGQDSRAVLQRLPKF